MQTHSAARSPSPRRSKIEVDPVKLGRELAGLTGRAELTDEEYATLASEWAETVFGKIAT
ncbi:MAG: hypothetical protein WA322_26710 [Pseudolabrys sp.]|jgi:hypothetical protein